MSWESMFERNRRNPRLSLCYLCAIPVRTGSSWHGRNHLITPSRYTAQGSCKERHSRLVCYKASSDLLGLQQLFI
ncbi:hypothetical protein XELAEV_18018217mg [Xenopus laevis]|uniref:Uncharacterized protein n=1 Tax=Xenopus laevis TaxID=8355 RepID=A0A974HTD7_XENLA|nr:hypothetical protein XELAEV_18018217mg [Xenopus laevis]